ncbi:MAG TPA: penicillin acylase family protein [Terriglobales bacterium]|nr:penicillin acylase family protein [Terriglobales bacterium]
MHDPGHITEPKLRRKHLAGMLWRVLAGIRSARHGAPLVSGTDPPLIAANLPPSHGSLEIVRDSNGVPHIYAEDERDLFAAAGYLQGADRFLFIDVLRHLGAGRLSSLFGDLAAPKNVEVIGGKRVSDIDRLVRPLGFERDCEEAFDRLGERERRCLTAFSDGINAALTAMQGVYPIEYLLLGAVRSWRPQDCLLTARTCAFVVSLTGLEHELAFDAVRGHLGDARARHLFNDVDWDDAPLSYTPGAGSRPQLPVEPPGGGSNNWVVGAARSATGKPLLANDPHVPVLPLPTFWFHAHLRGPGFELQGGMLPGCPVFAFGHNRAMAWGVTTGYRDGWDLYRVHRLPEDTKRYRTAGGSAPITSHREELPARLHGHVTIEWDSCDHGILYPGWKHADGVDLAVRHVSADMAGYFEGALALMSAASVAEHQQAVALLNDGPFDFNHTYAHKDGHFGWEIYGRLPKRAKDGLFVRDAHDPDGEWLGYVSFAEMPKILNPPRGYVATANSRTDDENYLAIATRSHFEPRFRQDRIEQRLAGDARHDWKSLADIQGDIGTDYGAPLAQALCALLPDSEANEAMVTARRLLCEWDGSFGCDSPAAAVFVWTMIELNQRVYFPLLGKELGQRFCNGRKARPRLHQLLLDGHDPLRSDIEAAAARSLSALAQEAVAAALDRLQHACGSQPAEWQWGAIQRVWLGTPLGLLPGIGRYFIALDEPFPGDDYTVNPSRSVPLGARLYSLVGPSSRFICDLSKPNEAWFAHSSGPSGDAFSPYFANLSAAWSRFEYFRSALWSPEQVPDPVERFVSMPRRSSGMVE